MKVTDDGPLYFEKPSWDRRVCPFSQKLCFKDACVAFQYEKPSTQGRGPWTTRAGGPPRDIYNVTCKALGIIFQIWDAKFVDANLKEIVKEQGDGDG